MAEAQARENRVDERQLAIPKVGGNGNGGNGNGGNGNVGNGQGGGASSGSAQSPGGLAASASDGPASSLE